MSWTWLAWLLPGNNGFRLNNSAKMHPTAHMSIASLYGRLGASSNSGHRYHLIINTVLLISIMWFELLDLSNLFFSRYCLVCDFISRDWGDFLINVHTTNRILIRFNEKWNSDFVNNISNTANCQLPRNNVFCERIEAIFSYCCCLIHKAGKAKVSNTQFAVFRY